MPGRKNVVGPEKMTKADSKVEREYMVKKVGEMCS